MDYKEFFSFTHQERRGIFVFLGFSFFAILFTEWWTDYQNHPPGDTSKFYISDDSLHFSEDQFSDEDAQRDLWDDSKNVKPVRKERFSFDPNQISSDSLRLLGFSAFAAKNLINYRNKGGKIKDLQKFKAIYGIDTSLVVSLSELITFNSVDQKGSNDPVNPEVYIVQTEKEPLKVELNSADSIQLDAIKGIGPYTVKKILQNRKNLGGFLYKEQLIELKIISDSLFQLISPILEVNPAQINKINLNTADFKTFIIHPYFTAETINAIIKYRKQHGEFKEAKHISRIKSLKEETGNKILPYLTTN